MRRYPPSTIHRYLDLPSTQIIQTHTLHRHNPTPPDPGPSPYPLSTYATTTKTQTHVQYPPPVPTGLVKPKPKYITSQQCATIGCTKQEVGSSHTLEATCHSPQRTCLRLLIHTTHNFRWSMYTLTRLNISQ